MENAPALHLRARRRMRTRCAPNAPRCSTGAGTFRNVPVRLQADGQRPLGIREVAAFSSGPADLAEQCLDASAMEVDSSGVAPCEGSLAHPIDGSRRPRLRSLARISSIVVVVAAAVVAAA